MPSGCSVKSCGRPVYGNGYCSPHYQRVRKWGSPREDIPMREPRKGRTCSVAECDQPVRCRGLCAHHYDRLRRTGSVNAARPVRLQRNRRKCSVDGCSDEAISRGFCNAHYLRVLATGDPQADVPVQKRSGRTGRHHNAHGYVRVPAPPGHPNAFGDGLILEHRLVMANELGRPLESDEQVHHRNGVRDDNRPENLELWVRGHPTSQRATDQVKWAREILARYGEVEDKL